MVTEDKHSILSADRLNGYAIIPMLTPFKENGSLDEAGVSALANHILDGACQGIMISGTTGEALSMDLKMRVRLVDLAVKSVKHRGIVLLGISDNCLERSLSLAKAGFAAGCDGVVAHLPSYYELNADQIESWFLSLADKIDGPMFLYNIPQTTGISIPVDVIQRLSRHSKIVGLKDSARDLERQLELARMFSDRNDFAFFTGYVGETEKIMSAGARGFVPGVGNFCPSLARDIMNAHLEGKSAHFESLLKRMMDISLMYQGTRTVSEILSAMKACASILGLCGPHMLLPLQTATNTEISNLRSSLEELKLVPSDSPLS